MEVCQTHTHTHFKSDVIVGACNLQEMSDEENHPVGGISVDATLFNERGRLEWPDSLKLTRWPQVSRPQLSTTAESRIAV